MLYSTVSCVQPCPLYTSTMFSSMDPVFIFLLATLFTFPYLLGAGPQNPSSHITIIGSVYCDVCYDNTFSKYSYFLPGKKH